MRDFLRADSMVESATIRSIISGLYIQNTGVFLKKTLGVPYAIADELRTIRNLRSVYVKVVDFTDVQNDIEVFVLGEPSKKAVATVLNRISKGLQRKIAVSYIDEPPIGKDYLELI